MKTIAVDPARIEHAHWDQKLQRREGGDIGLAYSADKIPDGQIRKPFLWQGQLMTTVGGGPGDSWEAYRLVELRLFDGTPTTYNETDFEAARNNPLGFYHGMTVKHGGETYVIVGPEIRFVGDPKLSVQKVEQLSLL